MKGYPVQKFNLWKDFCLLHMMSDGLTPLFDAKGKFVNTFQDGGNKYFLTRSAEMDSLVINETTKVIEDFNSGASEYEGLIYMMFWKESGNIIPLYIGKSEKYGRRGGNLSANILNIKRNKG